MICGLKPAATRCSRIRGELHSERYVILRTVQNEAVNPRLTRGRRPGRGVAETKSLACGHGLNNSNLDHRSLEWQGIISSRAEYIARYSDLNFNSTLSETDKCLRDRRTLS